MICIEFLRNPNKKVSDDIQKLNGEELESRGHYSKDQMIPLIRKISDENTKVTICGDEELNKKFGFTDECCWL